MTKTISSSCPDVELSAAAKADPHDGHSKRKLCVCGGHNQWNSKKKKGHNSTKNRLRQRRGKQGDNLKAHGWTVES